MEGSEKIFRSFIYASGSRWQTTMLPILKLIFLFNAAGFNLKWTTSADSNMLLCICCLFCARETWRILHDDWSFAAVVPCRFTLAVRVYNANVLMSKLMQSIHHVGSIRTDAMKPFENCNSLQSITYKWLWYWGKGGFACRIEKKKQLFHPNLTILANTCWGEITCIIFCGMSSSFHQCSTKQLNEQQSNSRF